ncbi:MAG: polymerase ECF-subfamily sigma factor [Thermoleophilia bacterium]|nr:polymerase ECF-subfamily sigma factor [Thermoleophilia bacterium]
MAPRTADPEAPAPAVDDAAALADSLGEPARFEPLFVRHVDALFRFAAVRVGPGAAEDVVAATFATAFARRAAFRAELGEVRGWLFGIAAVQLRRHGDQERRWLERCALAGSAAETEAPAREEDVAAAARLDSRTIRPRLATALALLSAGEREVLVLHAVAELSHEEIAAVLGIRRGTAKTRLSRATSRLRALLHDLDPATEDER